MQRFNQAKLLASKQITEREPFLTVAIPHYKQLSYLQVVLNSIFEQTFTDFELLISNDHSPDGSDEVLPPLLDASGIHYRYYSQAQNLGYDGNVRFCLTAAQGRYVFLLGNDDALADSQTLQRIADALRQLDFPAVAITNFVDWDSHQVVQRAVATQLLGSGIPTAIRFFRSFSFVSGLIYERQSALHHTTDKWDKSVYYQIYLACRMIAAGGRLATINCIAVRKDVRLNGETVPNYVTKGRDFSWSFQPRHTGVDSVIRVTCDAIAPLVPDEQRSSIRRQIIGQALMILHPYWILEYRRIANWSAGVGVARGHYPAHLLAEYPLSLLDKFYLWGLYLLITPIALLLPIGLFNRTRLIFAHLFRKRLQSVTTS